MMPKTSANDRRSGNFPSPRTPGYHNGNGSNSQGWSSEGVQLPSNWSNRSQIKGVSLFPLNNNSRGLPSKWEDAERWIFSPVSGDGGRRFSQSSSSYQHPLRKPKSKSGPLGPTGTAPMHEGKGDLSSHMGGSPFSSGKMLADELCFRVSDGGRSFSNNLESCIARSVSVHGCANLVCQDTSLIGSQDGVDDTKDPVNTVSRSVSRRDMATQMSPEYSCNSSPRSSSFSQSNSSNLPIEEVQNTSPLKPEVMDVQIDERVTLTQWLNKHKGQNPSKGSEDVNEWKLKALVTHSPAQEMSETVKNLSKARRDEAKITAWENLQKEKAEADLRKLEMKLEKKRSSSMNKIMKKLRSTQKKAEVMRDTMLCNQTTLQVSETNNNNPMSFRIRQMSFLGGCFTGHEF